MTYINGTPKRDMAAQVALLNDLDAKFRAAIAGEISATMRFMVDAYERTGSAPNLPETHVGNLAELYAHMAQASVTAFGSRIVVNALDVATPYTIDGKSFAFAESNGVTWETKGFAELFSRLALSFISSEAIRRRITSVSETTRTQVIGAISRGQSAGQSVDEIGAAIREHIEGASRTRAHIIARTETHGAANYGANEAAKATGLKIKKEWVASQDHRTRDFGEGDGDIDEFDHRSMDGQIVDMDQPFIMPQFGKDPILCEFPGDPTLPAGAAINCRCGVAHIVDDGAAPTQETPAPAPSVKPSYKDFKGVKTVADAEKYIIDNGIANVASLKGVSMKGMSKAIGAAHEVKERFGLDPLAYMGPISRDDRYRYRTPRGANAAVYPETRALHVPTKFGDTKDAQNQINAKRARAWQFEGERAAVLAKGNAVSEDVRSRIGRMRAGQYTWSITANTPEAERAKTMYHEYGHVLHLIDERGKGEIDDFLSSRRPRSEGWGLLVSKYGGSNDAEYVAEAFAVYMTEPETEHYRIHPELLGIFRRRDAEY